MKIVITNPTASPPIYVIANGREQSPLDDLDLAHTSAVQEVEFLRADSLRLFERKLARCDFTFSILYKRTDPAGAEKFIFQLATDVPRFGTLIFTSEAGSNGAFSWAIPNASCQIVSVKHIGSAVLATYRIRGGKPTTST